MTDERMAFLELIEKGADGDLVRELLAFAAERMMTMGVDALAGAPASVRSAERVNHRNGYRERGWETRVGRIDPAIPKLRKGSCDPAFLEARRTAEKALTAVIHRAPAGRAIQPWKGRCQETSTGRPMSTACRPAPSTTWSGRWAGPWSRRAESAASVPRSTSASRPS
jgi:hypothetical protein